MDNNRNGNIILDVTVIVIFLSYCAITIPGISDRLIDDQYNTIKDVEYKNGIVISFGKYNVNFTNYRKTQYNESWVIHEITNNKYNTYVRLS